MVAVIKVGKSIHRTFHYNENKVKAGVAELLLAANFPLETDKLSENQRLNMLLRTAESNPNVSLNSVHITLNFAPGEDLADQRLKDIATDYMEQIGFAGQPFLVYKHQDAGHPHIHIATVKVRPDGTRIETQNIGKNLSEPARKMLEHKYGLIKAEDHKRQLFSLKKIDILKVQYGKSDTKSAIGTVLDHVLSSYKYTNLHELNAVLNLYNVHAERGGVDSRVYKHKGLLYRILDDGEKPIGVPVKASLFHNKPTYSYLKKLFLKNDIARQEHKKKVKANIDFMLQSKQPKTLKSLADSLKTIGIKLVLRTNKDGQIYGMTYVDLKSKCVFNGSSLGKEYAAKRMLERLDELQDKQMNILKTSMTKQNALPPEKDNSGPNVHIENTLNNANENTTSDNEKSLLEYLFQHEYASQAVPFEWKKKKKRKKK